MQGDKHSSSESDKIGQERGRRSLPGSTPGFPELPSGGEQGVWSSELHKTTARRATISPSQVQQAIRSDILGARHSFKRCSQSSFYVNRLLKHSSSINCHRPSRQVPSHLSRKPPQLSRSHPRSRRPRPRTSRAVPQIARYSCESRGRLRACERSWGIVTRSHRGIC